MKESGEMYLETILVLGKAQDEVHAIDIANSLKFSKASVSKALARLKADKFIVVDERGLIALTEVGRSLAEKIYKRHQLLCKALTSIGVKEDTALEDACRIEHYISDETYKAIKNYMKGKNG
ncbi:MAG: metal-dependent transcriptional regulator [Coriobacteriia bacterium]|nr:metal-dependent transcriptional regulator [Coriobacteriia bacterium]